MPAEYDVVVLGAGVAGTAAALGAADKGARVCVITAAPAATALFSGAWRGPCPDRIHGALRDAGYELHKCDGPLPHPVGSVIRCGFTVQTHRDAGINKDALVCGITGLPAFDAAALARLWSARSGKSLSAVTLTLAGTPRVGWAPASLAAAIERDPALVIAPLRAALAQMRPHAVILPAILGLDAVDALHTRIAHEIDCRLGEALASAPSIPGWRLHNALRRALRARGIALLEGRAVASEQAGRRIREVRVGESTVHARAFVLATGKFAAGGITAGESFQESVFGCPVWIEHLGGAFRTPDPLILTDAVRTEDQPLLRAGVHANETQQPVDGDDDVVYENVFVAGSVRSGWNVLTYGIGDCAQDGLRAGALAAQA